MPEIAPGTLANSSALVGVGASWLLGRVWCVRGLGPARQGCSHGLRGLACSGRPGQMRSARAAGAPAGERGVVAGAALPGSCRGDVAVSRSSQPVGDDDGAHRADVRSRAWWAASGRDRAGADLPGQEARCDNGPARVEGGAGLRPPRRRDRGAHPGPARPHRPRHPQPHPRARRARRRDPQPRRPDQDRLHQRRRPDGPARRRAAGTVRADGRTYTLERAAHARSVATAKGRRIGRPVLVDPDKLAYAAYLRDTGHTITEIIAKTGIARTSLYRHLPARPPEQLTVTAPPHPADHQAPANHQAPGDQPPGDQPHSQTVPSTHSAAAELLEAVDWPDGYRPPCPACTRPTIGLREQWTRRAGVREPVIVVRACPCGCAVDEHATQLQQAAPHTAGSTAPTPTTSTTPATS